MIAEFVDDVAEHAEAARARAAAYARAVDELTGFLGYVVEASATDRAVKAAAHALGAQPVDKAGEARVTTPLAELVRAAQVDGDIRDDVTVEDLYLLFTSAPTDSEPAARSRWLTLVIRGLSTHG